MKNRHPFLVLFGGLLCALAPITHGEEDSQEYMGSAALAGSVLLTPGSMSGSMTFLIDDEVVSALVIVTSPSKTLTVSLTDPSSNTTVVGGTGPGISGSGTFPLDADTDPLILGKDYAFRLEAPETGTWTIDVTETVTLTEDLPVVHNTWLESEIQGFMVGGSEDYPAGGEVVLGIFMMDGTAALSGYTIDCTVFRKGDASFTPTAIAFADDGVFPDFEAAEGLHTGSVVLSEAGEYDIRATITGMTAGGFPFERVLFSVLQVIDPCATLVTTTVTDSSVDDDLDLLIDHVVISNDVDVTVAGDYHLQVDLESAGGNVSSRSAMATLPVGTSTMSVQFDPDAIQELGEDGPWEIKKIKLEKILPAGGEVQDILFDLGPTQAYLLSDLERDPILITDFLEFPEDCDGDGDFDLLTLVVEIDVLTAATYEISTSLTDADGDEIDFINGFVFLSVGPNLVGFEFDAYLISARGGDGPYSLSSALIFSATDTLVAGSLGSTAAYTHDQWQAPPTTVPIDEGFEAFSLGAIDGQQGWTQSMGVAPGAAMITTTARQSGANALEMHIDAALGDGMPWGVFSPLNPEDNLEQVAEVSVRLAGSGGPSYDILVQSPSEGMSVAWVRLTAAGDVEVYQPWAGGFAFVSAGYSWLSNIGVDTYFDVSVLVNTLEPPNNQVVIRVGGVNVFTGPHLGSTFAEQISIMTDNTGPDVALFVDDVSITNRFMQVDCNFNGQPDACDIGLGVSQDCNGNGVPDECDVTSGLSEDCDSDFIPDECDILTDDCNGNGIPDLCDIASGFSVDCNGNGLPDDCDLAAGTSLDCNGNGIPDECDIASGFSIDCNLNGVPDDCDLAAGTSLDCNSNGIPDDCDIATGFSLDCNLNGVPDDCDLAAGTSLDCNSNGVPDECDIAFGTSPDCNGNDVPDECDIAAGTSLDCNTNDVPDECDVATGTSPDCNGNGIPDECDISSGFSLDCNGNTVPDECDVATGTSPDCNGNGLPDECDISSGASSDLDVDGLPDECEDFIRGDVNVDGDIGLDDAVLILDYLIGATTVFFCFDNLDTNDDGAINIVDPIYLLSYEFTMGAMPPAPFPACGPDLTPTDPWDCPGDNPGCP